MLTKEQRDYLLPAAYNAVLRAGDAILKIYLNGDYDISLKNDKTPITVADRESHRVIREYLSHTRVPLLSEEGREMLYHERRDWDLFWMVDPLDGTKEFIKENGEFTINIALMYENRPVLSVIYVPYIGKVYFCDRERGVFTKDGVKPNKDAKLTIDDIFTDARPLPITKEQNNPVIVAISRSHNTEETYRYVNMLKLKYPNAKVVEQGSSYKFCMLAEGGVDLYVRTTNTYEWDTAAGDLILEMAGGQTVSIPSLEPFEYNKQSLINPYFLCISPNIPPNFNLSSLFKQIKP